MRYKPLFTSTTPYTYSFLTGINSVRNSTQNKALGNAETAGAGMWVWSSKA